MSEEKPETETVRTMLGGRHQDVWMAGRRFGRSTYAGLPPHQAAVSKACINLAAEMLAKLPDSPDLAAGLQQLADARNSFVRAAQDDKESNDE